MKKYFLLLIFLYSSILLGAIDYHVNSTVRTFPKSMYSEAVIGSSYRLWDKSSGPQSFLYGYGRVSAKARTSVVVNSVSAQASIFPISILGIFGGISKFRRDYDKFDSFNCSILSCDSNLTRKYYGTKFALKIKQLFFVGKFVEELIDVDDSSKDFADEQGSVIGRRGRDRRVIISTIAGFNINSKITAGILNVSNKMKFNGSSSVMSLSFITYKYKDWKFLGGAGVISGHHFDTSFTCLFNAKWVGLKGDQLF